MRMFRILARTGAVARAVASSSAVCWRVALWPTSIEVEVADGRRAARSS